MEFEKVKSYLSEQVDNNGTSIYSHIAAISRKIVEEKPQNAYESFENISLQIKQSKLNVNSDDNNNVNNINQQERQEIQANIDSILTSYGRKPEKIPKKPSEEDEEEEEPEEEEEEEEQVIDVAKCSNILAYEQLLKYAGIALDYEECYQLQHAFTRLIRKFGENIETSRFWGKIQAIDNDYYVVEAKLSEYPEPEEDEEKVSKNEDPGQGANEFVYFVTTNIESGDWIKLKDVTPEQIKKSRQIHRLFTGNLESKIGGRIHFEGTEAELLRAQIARISSSTTLAPNEYYQKPEEEEDEENPFVIELNEEFEPNEEGGISQESWVHSRGHLRLEGRFKRWIEPEKEEEEDEDGDDADGDDEEKEPNPEELEEEIPILQAILNDKCKEFSNGGEDEDDGDDNESSNCWFIRELNKNMPYKIVVINNKLWNGAKTIYVSNTKTFVNVYIGNGIKYRGEYYTPSPPAIIQSQFNEFKEVEIPDPENEEETITKQESIFAVQTEQMPPPPQEEEAEANPDGDGDEEDAE